MERARELAKRYVGRPGVVGIYLVGSASRPFRDRISDYDIEVALDDAAYETTPLEERHVFAIDEGPPRRVDHEFYLRPWSELRAMEGSTHDLDHYPFRHAVILYDPQEELSTLFPRLALLPPAVRETRIKVHYAETAFSLGRATKCLDRGNAFAARLVLGDGALALVKLLAVVRGSWAPTRHWAAEELAILGVPEDLLAQASGVLSRPSPEGIKGLRNTLHAWLDVQGVTVHRDGMALIRWAFLTPEGKAAFRTWGAR
ncbi:MAG: hypothetical protein BIP78_1084 [Candidatus Bipolaricaulis sibiricus]|uniref:DUF4037 domain-containing protein n=1 Tax=Bipolaricaulis sibiricus TaxID=2501609 RepID=A0A410FVC1_BIPS1|nr:MAG: hypothetical protein BIP78_1084 [Candidatus Bipolaricaulis sibiricus]